MNAAVRCYVDGGERPRGGEFDRYYNPNLVFVFDFETKADMYQDMLFGCCGIWENGRRTVLMLVYADGLSEKQMATLRECARKHKMGLISREEFVELFYRCVYWRRGICVGFNLPFDISRVAIGFGTSRKDNTAFSFKLSEKPYHPRIIIKHIDSKSSFIGFTKPLFRNRKKARKYAGTFVDLRTLAFALTNERHSLESACEEFDVEHKKLKIEEHGKITPEYIEYNVNDVLATYDLYVALSGAFQAYNLSMPLNRLYSPASIGKAYLEAMGIKPFLTQNPDFPKDMLGKIMSTYYGGRVEVHIRKQPVPVAYLDFTSMYPTMFELLDLWPFVTADKIEMVEDDGFAERLDKMTLEDLQDKETWGGLCGIALVDSDYDILPARAKYGSKKVYNIGLNHVKGRLWYTYSDIIASKLLTGKTPKIIKAYRFVPNGTQKSLRPIDLFGKTIDPGKTSFIKVLIEHRLEVKEKLRRKKADKELESQDYIAKIIANSTAYGISVEVNAVQQSTDVDVYGLEHFRAHVDREERQGKAFNPIVATLTTAGARLILAMAEALITRNGGYYAYCDTDSIFVNPESVRGLQEFFKPLNPYDKPVEMFKVEKADDGTPLDNVLFYGVSAKRYCLYKLDNGVIEVLKHSSHGLGYISGMPKGWEKSFWTDLLRYHYGMITLSDIENRYRDNVIAAQLSVSSPQILKRFSNFGPNKSKSNANALSDNAFDNTTNISEAAKDRKNPTDGVIKPFNFITAGVGYRLDNASGEAIIPAVPFTKVTASVKYAPFVDYKTGKYYHDNTQFYWKPLSELPNDYLEHKEEKYDGHIGELKRKKVVIDGVIHIGKESSNLEETEVIGVSDNDYVIYDNKIEQKITDVIKNMTTKDARHIGLSKRHLFRLKKRIKEGKKIVLKKKTVKKLGKLFKDDGHIGNLSF